MLVGIIRLNPITRQYSVETMAAKVPQGKNTTLRLSGKSMGAKRYTTDVLMASGTEANAVDQTMTINRRLVAQIETLRLKVDVDSRHPERTKSNLLTSTESKIQSRDLELLNLKAELKQKDDKLSALTNQNETKSYEIRSMQDYIVDLKDDVKVSKNYVDDIQGQLEHLRRERKSLQTGSAYRKKDEEIQRLQNEVDTLKKNLQILEKELLRAKEKIAKQGGQLRLTDMDRGNMQIKFKEELAKVTVSVRSEIERIRDVMKQQWEEMREFREQNEDMRNDIKEIRELLTEQVQGETNRARIYGHVHSPFDVQPESPSLPTINKNKKRLLPGKKKS